MQLSMSIATMEEEIVNISVKLNQAIRQQFSRKFCKAQFWISRSLSSYFKIGQLFWLNVADD